LNECVLDWVAKLSAHFGAQQDDEQIKIFLHALRDNTTYQVETAFERCLNECEFMPKLHDIHQRMPLDKWPPENPGTCRYRKPTLDLIKPVAEEICEEFTGKKYAQLTAEEMKSLWNEANTIRFIRMGRTGAWLKPTGKQLEMAARGVFQDWENV